MWTTTASILRAAIQAALGKFSGVARKHPTFPFAHYALAICALGNEDPTWRQHAERRPGDPGTHHTDRRTGRGPRTKRMSSC